MGNEIEKTFFDTFSIKNNMCKYAKYGYDGTEGTWYFCDKNQKECWTYPSNTTCKDKMTSYPEITDRILLELICILSGWKQYCISYYIIDAVNINTLKVDILRDCICMLHWYEFNKCGKDIKQQVQALFEDKTNGINS